MRSFVLMCAAVGGTVDTGIPFDPVGMYLAAYDPEAHDGRGFIDWTDDAHFALKFATIDDVLDFCNQVPVARPIREDGKPNRPIKAFHLLVHTVEEP